MPTFSTGAADFIVVFAFHTTEPVWASLSSIHRTSLVVSGDTDERHLNRVRLRFHLCTFELLVAFFAELFPATTSCDVKRDWRLGCTAVN